MAFINDPRLTQDPVGVKSTRARVLEDVLSEGVVLALSAGNASNYRADQYGSLIRVTYESIAKLLAGVIVDGIDLAEDSLLADVRPEYLSSRILYFIFKEGEEPLFDGSDELRSQIDNTLKSIVTGTTRQSIELLLSLSAMGLSTEVSLSEKDYIVEALMSTYGLTEQAIDPSTSASLAKGQHRHYTFTKSTGLGSTGAPLGYLWGDDLHVHEIVDGVLQPHTDSDGITHTHELGFGLSEDILKVQENIKRLFDVTRPAHVKLGEVSSLLSEDVENPVGSMSLSVGASFQEDMRYAREGTYESAFYVYSDGSNRVYAYNSNLAAPDEVYIKESPDAPSGTRRRVVSVTEELLPDGDYTISSARINYVRPTFNYDEFISSDQTYTVVDGTFTSKPTTNQDFSFFARVVGGDPITFINAATGESYLYFLKEKKRPRQNLLGYVGGRFTAVRQVVALDNPVSLGNRLNYLENLSSPYRSKGHITYKEVRGVFVDPNINNSIINFDVPSDTLVSFRGLPITAFEFELHINGVFIGDLLNPNESLWSQLYPIGFSEGSFQILGSVAQAYIQFAVVQEDPNQFNQWSSRKVLNDGDEFILRYPSGVSQKIDITALNQEPYVLNGSRKPRIGVQGYAERGGGFQRSSRPFVLPFGEKVTPKTSTRREIKSELLGGLTLNSSSNLDSFLLNSHKVDTTVSPRNVFAPAVGSGVVMGGRVSYADLGFSPRDLISVVVGGESFQAELTEGYVLLSNPPADGSIATVTAISTKPYKSGDWFKGDELSEGQVAFKSSTQGLSDPPLSPPTADEVMANPQGRPTVSYPLPAQDFDREVSGRIEETMSGTAGELIFYEDALTELSISGGAFNQPMPTLTEGVRQRANNARRQITADNYVGGSFGIDFMPMFVLGGRNGNIVHSDSVLNENSILTPSRGQQVEQVQVTLFIP